MRLINLMYHDVVAPGEFDSSGFAGAAANLYKLDIARFEGHLAAIAGAAGVGAAVADALNDAAGGVLLTFDDGGASFPHIAEMLEHRGWRGHFFVTTDYIGTPGFMNEADIRDLHERGHVIGSHSCSHPERISRCNREQLSHEWGDSVARLRDVIGAAVTTASVPGGFYSAAVADTAREAGIDVLFNSEPTTRVFERDGCRVLGRFAMERLNAEAAGHLAAGASWPRIRQAAMWQAKKMAKAVGGRYWFALRKRMLGDR